jgi:hypothetical protein
MLAIDAEGQRQISALSIYGLASHSASAPAGGTAGVSSHAGTIYHVHSRATCFADSDDLSVRLLEGREWHSLCQRGEGQSKNDCDQPRHLKSWPMYANTTLSLNRNPK